MIELLEEAFGKSTWVVIRFDSNEKIRKKYLVKRRR